MTLSQKKIFIIALVALSAIPLAVFAAGTPVTINPNLPGAAPASSGTPWGFVANFYQFALMIGGVLAFGVVVYGGVKYMMSAGNPSGQSDAKEWIWGALLGLLLLAGAYLILNTINPALVHLQLPTLAPISIQGSGGGSGGGTGGSGGSGSSGGDGNSGTATGCAGGSCQNLEADGLTCKPASQQPGGVESCSAAQGMVNTLQCMQENGAPPFTVTEAMPPTNPSGHISKCHNDGCCVDVTVNSGNCNDVQAMKNAAAACGAPPIGNEYISCGGTATPDQVGNNLHVTSKSGGGC
jgi:Type IV secretion system pilin